MSSQRVMDTASVSSTRTLNLNEAIRTAIPGGRVVGRIPDSRRPMVDVAAFHGVRRGSFAVNGYQIDVDPLTDSLTDILSRIELTAPNTRATFSAVSNKVVIASKTDRSLALADGAAAFLQAVSVMSGTFAVDAAQGADAAAAARAAQAAEAARAAQGAQQSVQGATAAKAMAEAAEQAAAQAAARQQIASAVNEFQQAFNQFASIEEPLVTYDSGGRVAVAASGRTQLDRLVSAAFDRAGLQGGGPASARFDVSSDLSFRFDTPQAVLQVDANSVADSFMGGGSPATEFLFGDSVTGTRGLLADLKERVGDFISMAKNGAPANNSQAPATVVA